MKVRNGFVSNSSTTSFTCDLCHKTEKIDRGGVNKGIEYTTNNMLRCENGCVFCVEHMDESILSLEQKIKSSSDYNHTKYNGYWRDNVPEKYCPRCNIDKLSADDVLVSLVDYLNEVTIKEAIEAVKKRYDNYEDFDRAMVKYRKALKSVDEVVL